LLKWKIYRRRKLSPVELTRFLLERIARLNPRLNAYLTLNPEMALKDAAAAEAALAPSPRKSSRDLGRFTAYPSP